MNGVCHRGREHKSLAGLVEVHPVTAAAEQVLAVPAAPFCWNEPEQGEYIPAADASRPEAQSLVATLWTGSEVAVERRGESAPPVVEEFARAPCSQTIQKRSGSGLNCPDQSPPSSCPFAVEYSFAAVSAYRR